jgi:hypothetical protein
MYTFSGYLLLSLLLLLFLNIFLPRLTYIIDGIISVLPPVEETEEKDINPPTPMSINYQSKRHVALRSMTYQFFSTRCC